MAKHAVCYMVGRELNAGGFAAVLRGVLCSHEVGRPTRRRLGAWGLQIPSLIGVAEQHILFRVGV